MTKNMIIYSVPNISIAIAQGMIDSKEHTAHIIKNISSTVMTPNAMNIIRRPVSQL